VNTLAIPENVSLKTTVSQATSITMHISIELPDSVFSALRSNPETFVQEMRLAAAVKWYEIGIVSQSKAAEIAGVSRHEFLEALNRFNVSPFQVTSEELAEELARE
jgi:predicted HTH domain antitoxin